MAICYQFSTLSTIIGYGHEKNGLFIFNGITCLSNKHINVITLSDLKLVNNCVKKETNEPS